MIWIYMIWVKNLCCILIDMLKKLINKMFAKSIKILYLLSCVNTNYTKIYNRWK